MPAHHSRTPLYDRPVISFGTDGWRAVIADGFTFDNVRRVTNAIAMAGRGLQPPPDVDRNALVVGYDRRFLSREFAETVAETLRAAGYRVILSTSPTPSQAISFTAKHRKLLGGVMVTASHNPAKYNGIKFKAWYGGSALPEMYAAIADALGRGDAREGGSVSDQDLLGDYVAALRAQVGAIDLRILHDPIHGVAAGLPARVLGIGVTTIRGEVNPSFGGVNPEPIPENLAASMAAMKAGGHNLALCNDGDADRLGVLDERGAFVSPHKIIALLALYLVREKKMRGEIVKTFSTTRLIEKVAHALGAGFHETPIGFKYVADLMLSRDVLVGGEESGGIGFGHFLPERDGVLSGLVVAEAVAHYKKPLSAVLAEMEAEFGAPHYDRRDLHRPTERCAALIERARAGALDGAFGSGFVSREEKDGVKLNFADGSWILFRRSGTEPMIRIYSESPDASRVQQMLETATRELDR
jgi:phosphomannomutase